MAMQDSEKHLTKVITEIVSLSAFAKHYVALADAFVPLKQIVSIEPEEFVQFLIDNPNH